MASTSQRIPAAVNTSQTAHLGSRQCPPYVFNSLSKPEDFNDGAVTSDHRGDRFSDSLSPTSGHSPRVSPLTPLDQAHTPEYATVATPSRYNHIFPSFCHYNCISPVSTVPLTAHNSRAPFPEAEESDYPQPTFASLRWRLASGYLACFVIGWADGGTSPGIFPLDIKLSQIISFQSPVLSCLVSNLVFMASKHITSICPLTDLKVEFNLSTMTLSLLWAGTTCG